MNPAAHEQLASRNNQLHLLMFQALNINVRFITSINTTMQQSSNLDQLDIKHDERSVILGIVFRII